MAELTIYQALNAVMSAVQAVGKDGRNTQQNFNFRGIDSVVNAVGPALRDNGVIVTPRVLSRHYESYESRNGAQMRNAVLEVEFTFHGPDGSTIVCSALGEASDAGDKATPKAHSVAFRTALLQALCIPTDEPDPDATTHERAAAPAPEPVISTADADRIKALINPDRDARKAWLAKFSVPPHLLPATRLDEANDFVSDLEPIEGTPS